EPIGLGVRDVPHHLEADVDDVLVARQHQRAGIAVGGADVGGALARHLDLFIGHDRPGGEVQTGFPDARGAAQRQFDAALFRADGIEGHEGPAGHQRQRQEADTLFREQRSGGRPAPAAAAVVPAIAAAAAHQDAQLLLPLAHDLVDLGDLRALAGPPAAAAPPIVTAAILVVGTVPAASAATPGTS